MNIQTAGFKVEMPGGISNRCEVFIRHFTGADDFRGARQRRARQAQVETLPYFEIE